MKNINFKKYTEFGIISAISSLPKKASSGVKTGQTEKITSILNCRQK